MEVIMLVMAFFSIYFFFKVKYTNEIEQRREEIEHQSI